ncbi:MAG: endonuclease/exonuclease/phosphatase family protein, partial [Bacteroidales bacterium]|nr:endonuclease/exonuclease/phosphatase family protein [Bacteroidales bacterium]
MRREIFIIMIVLLYPCGSGAQVVFWNLENYFDTKENPLTEDDDFTPEGSYHWTYWKYEQKRNLIAKGIMATAEQLGSFPSIIAVAEAENRQVL